MSGPLLPPKPQMKKQSAAHSGRGTRAPCDSICGRHPFPTREPLDSRQRTAAPAQERGIALLLHQYDAGLLWIYACGVYSFIYGAASLIPLHREYKGLVLFTDADMSLR